MNIWRTGVVFEVAPNGTAFVEDAQTGEVFGVSAAACIDAPQLLQEGHTVSFQLNGASCVEAIAVVAEPVAA